MLKKKKDLLLFCDLQSHVECELLLQENKGPPVWLLLSWVQLQSWTMNCDYRQHPPAERQLHLRTFQETQPAKDSKYTREEET